MSGEPLLQDSGLGCTVLLAEEDEELRDVLAVALRREGFTVVEVEDGLELEDYLSSALSNNAPWHLPDVIVSDAEMHGHSGLEVVAWFRQRDFVTPVVLLNLSRNQGVYAWADELDVDCVIDGPVDEDEVCDAVSLLG